jgi:hypothetical protein
MKDGLFNHRVKFGCLLILLSIFVYAIHYAIFRDAHHIGLFVVSDIAFVFIEVLLVTLIIHKLLSDREKQAMIKKLNMVIGAFFSEVGTDLLNLSSPFDANHEQLAGGLLVNNEWTAKQFETIGQVVAGHKYKIDAGRGDIAQLRDFLIGKRDFLLSLLGNPNLLEHESFTELLWAVFHLTEELAHRKDVTKLSKTDADHISGDIDRAYKLLAREWLSHMEHLKKDYPYLFSLAVRCNPFDPQAAAEVG